jgi:hypothetical protein
VTVGHRSSGDLPKAVWFCAGDSTRLALIPLGINPSLVESFLEGLPLTS